MNILVTGSSGFVGRYLVAALAERGHRVIGIDRDRLPQNEAALDRFVQGDLLDPGTLHAALDGGVEYVVHLAAALDDFTLSDEEFFRDNLEATEALIETGRGAGVSDWLFFSSVAAVGKSTHATDEDTIPEPLDAYGASKLAAERRFRTLAGEHPEQRVVMLRPSVIYGPGNYDTTNVYRLIDAIHRNRFLMVGDGDVVKTTSYVENTVAAALFLMKREPEGDAEVFHYVDAPALTNEDLAARIYAELGKWRPPVRLPLALASRLALVADAVAELTGVNLPITSARIRKFCRPTNFKAEAIREAGLEQPVSNEEALRRTVEWHVGSGSRPAVAPPAAAGGVAG